MVNGTACYNCYKCMYYKHNKQQQLHQILNDFSCCLQALKKNKPDFDQQQPQKYRGKSVVNASG